jgi:uncharacterized protein DUF4412
MALQRTAIRTIALPTLLAALAVPSALVAQDTFEGVLTVRVAGPQGRGGTMDYSIRRGVVRMDFAGPMGQAAMIMDPAAKKMYMVVPSQQMYMEQALATDFADEAVKRGKPDITKTGKSETVAGYQCEHWLVKDQGEEDTHDVCMAKGIGAFLTQGGMRGGASEPSWFAELRQGGYFPLKMVDKSGKATWEVTKIEKKSLDASLFGPPAGYRKMEMPAGMPRRP